MPRVLSRNSRDFFGLCAAVAFASAGCDGTAGPAGGGQAEVPAVGRQLADRVVADVSGSAITSADVRRAMQDLGVNAKAALDRLEAERLLMAEAERRGFGRHRQVAHVGRQAAVQALLAEQVEASGVSDEELEEAYQEHLDRFRRPERRGSAHVLAKLGRDAKEEVSRAGEQFARQAIAALARAQEPDQVLQRFEKRQSDRFQVVVERIPPIPRDAPFASEYKEALFGMAKTGVIPRPVRTDFGWHAVVLTEIQPAMTISLKRAAEVLRPALERKKRERRLQALLAGLRERTPVSRNEATIQWVLSADRIGGKGP